MKNMRSAAFEAEVAHCEQERADPLQPSGTLRMQQGLYNQNELEQPKRLQPISW